MRSSLKTPARVHEGPIIFTQLSCFYQGFSPDRGPPKNPSRIEEAPLEEERRCGPWRCPRPAWAAKKNRLDAVGWGLAPEVRDAEHLAGRSDRRLRRHPRLHLDSRANGREVEDGGHQFKVPPPRSAALESCSSRFRGNVHETYAFLSRRGARPDARIIMKMRRALFRSIPS